MRRREAVFAEASELSKHGASKVDLSTETLHGNGSALQYKNWTFASFHNSMIDSTQLENLEKNFVTLSKKQHLHIPPMIFGNDLLSITQGNGDGKESDSASSTVNEKESFSLSFTSKDALEIWARWHDDSNTTLEEDKLKIVRVPYANKWYERFHSEIVNGTQQAKDRGLSSNEQPSVYALSSAIHNSNTSTESKDMRENRQEIEANMTKNDWDWTFSSDYCGTLGKSILHSRFLRSLLNDSKTSHDTSDSSTSSMSILSLQAMGSSSINYNILRNTSAPILFYDEFVLYQDDLEDCGEVQFNIKLRVMPACWFVLVTMFLRVDDVVIRLIENRYFHEFDTTFVCLDSTIKQYNMSSEEDKMSPTDSPSMASATTVFSTTTATTTTTTTTTTTATRSPPSNGGDIQIPRQDLRNMQKMSQMIPIQSQHHFRIPFQA